jgi:hypothetical protein
LARPGKRKLLREEHAGQKADEYKKILLEKFFQQCQDNYLIIPKKKRIGIFYE